MIIRDDLNGKRGDEPARRKPLKPVKGQLIRLSMRMTAWCLLGFAVWGVVGAVVLVILVRDTYEHVFRAGPGLKEPLVRLLIGGGGVIGAPLLAAGLIRKARRGRRIVIGADRVQILEGWDEDTCVVVCVPYENIEELKCTEVGYWHKLDFEVCDTHDPETYFAGNDIESNFLTHGYHYELTGGYSEPMEEIEVLIRRAWKKWARRSEGERA